VGKLVHDKNWNNFLLLILTGGGGAGGWGGGEGTSTRQMWNNEIHRPLPKLSWNCGPETAGYDIPVCSRVQCFMQIFHGVRIREYAPI
jgi:hypothetical protein